eukprot:CAMPEP_0183297052 /NCGR_PEP_ID=MMETSP0160_2-20130417/4431_1 /TAXON_ID=2839 ORGANISM="Odontella Sinensis, Strain Grunow 1884" /NCGR_SAMPLE_ID=MMETSP0160_2 /ASSEMBLY_ACC=CAM_ASM_000250 /LENGTH=581 /DNA_ID=CAMNT_0025458787 /DNA_START=133 /DNA_END=1878 /DNA_ORIENTATION=+
MTRALKKANYEIWASDQSNSVAGISATGVRGSYLWIWNSADIERQLSGGPDATPLGCGQTTGPCDLLKVFPQDLKEFDASGSWTGNYLEDMSNFGRLHGMISDPQQRYVTANIFHPNGGFVGIIDARRKEAVALFRVTGTNVGGAVDKRSVHMSFFDATGDAVIIANLNGKVVERLDIKRKGNKIVEVVFNRSASLGLSKGMKVTSEATVFHGENENGRKMLGGIGGDYASADFGDLTPNGVCKENECDGTNGAHGGRPNNVVVCPLPSSGGNVYVTFGGGGLLVLKSDATPMEIVGEYGNEVVNGAGCGGAQVGDHVWLNAGVSASGAGATQSTFTVYKFDDTGFDNGPNPENMPEPTLVFKDYSNTNTLGNLDGVDLPNNSGQLPGTTTRRDAHGAEGTADQTHTHITDRIQNVVEVFDTMTLERTSYDLTSADGQGNGVGPCALRSVMDDVGLPHNDPAPDVLTRTPDGKYLIVAFRGPVPVTVSHAAQGSCPGVGIVEVSEGGASGKLVDVLRTVNTLDTSLVNIPGGHQYTGDERSDIHAVTVVGKTRKGKKKSKENQKSKKSEKKSAPKTGKKRT